MSTWKCANCEAVIRPTDADKPNVDWKRRQGAPGKWDAYCRECGALAHQPAKVKPKSTPKGTNTAALAGDGVSCSATTRHGKPCPLLGDRTHPETGKPVCHVHDPNGKAQRKIAERRGS
jgi:hypothetical protein